MEMAQMKYLHKHRWEKLKYSIFAINRSTIGLRTIRGLYSKGGSAEFALRRQILQLQHK